MRLWSVVTVLMRSRLASVLMGRYWSLSIWDTRYRSLARYSLGTGGRQPANQSTDPTAPNRRQSANQSTDPATEGTDPASLYRRQPDNESTDPASLTGDNRPMRALIPPPSQETTGQSEH